MFENGTEARELKLQVTTKGFEPARLRVARNEPITLVVTRKTERTCATEIVIDEYGIDEELPIGEPVRIMLTPNTSGPVRFGCAMDKMVSGILDVV